MTDSAGAERAAISRFAYSVGSHGVPVTELFRIDESSVRYTCGLKVLRLGHVLLRVKDTQQPCVK